MIENQLKRQFHSSIIDFYLEHMTINITGYHLYKYIQKVSHFSGFPDYGCFLVCHVCSFKIVYGGGLIIPTAIYTIIVEQ